MLGDKLSGLPCLAVSVEPPGTTSEANCAGALAEGGTDGKGALIGLYFGVCRDTPVSLRALPKQ